ncbi:MAG: hybrid sensor histidine kinase/response regulator [bacterium]
MIINSDPVTIMIIDDEHENLNVLGEMFRQEGWSIRAFPRGDLALAAAGDEMPDIILLDILMPGMDGYEVCRRFKADDRLCSIPIIFLSAFSDPTDKVRAFEAGGVDYITKPFFEREVWARTHTHLGLRRYQIHLEKLVRQRVQELAEANRRLSIWDDAKNQWLNMLSHEMRTPLSSILGTSELLFMEVSQISSVNSLRETYDYSCRRMTKLIEDAETLSHIDVASESFGLSPLSLSNVLRTALNAFAGQMTECEVQASLLAIEQVTVLGEENLLSRAFTDLLLTAACCVCKGDPFTLETSVSEGQAHVVITFGRKTFTPDALGTFFEVGGQRTLIKGGGDFGLGAALASRILRLFNGQVSIRNDADKGLIIASILPIT